MNAPGAIPQQHRTAVTIIDPDGNATMYPEKTETLFVNELGQQLMLIEQHRYGTADGRSVKPEELAHCTKCHHRIAPQATSFCEHCQALLCKDCAQQPPRCNPCRKKEQRRKLLQWLTSL